MVSEEGRNENREIATFGRVFATISVSANYFIESKTEGSTERVQTTKKQITK